MTYKLNKTLILTIILFIVTANLRAQFNGSDSARDNMVKNASKVWTATNLNVSHFRNGDTIPEIEDSASWAIASNNGQPAWCYYQNDPVIGKQYHKLYNWYAINDSRGLAPIGWHVPSTSEWDTLTNTFGGEDSAGSKMKSTTGWYNNGNGTFESGFIGLPGGFRNSNGAFHNIGKSGNWWSSSESTTDFAWYRNLSYGLSTNVKGSANKGDGFSVRCVKD